jgi:cytochrome c nitrite reductase small subunit
VTRKKLIITGAIVLAGVVILGAAATPKLIAWSSTPQFCNACHVMNDQYETWFLTGVHRTIQCIDCHLPNGNFAEHMLWKSIDGTRDLVSFHTGTYPVPIEITDRGRGFIQENCIRCHQGVVSRIATDGQECWSCHRRMNHKAAIFSSAQAAN